LGGFKAFRDIEHLPIRPITLIYGENSSGKSSILQALLLLKQTIDQSEDPSIPLLPKGNLVDLGGYREMAHGHVVDRPIAFQFSFDALGRVPGATPRFDPSLGSFGLRTEFGFAQESRGARLERVGLLAEGADVPMASWSVPARAPRRSPQTVRRQSRVDSLGQVLAGEGISKQHPAWRPLFEYERREGGPKRRVQLELQEWEQLLQSLRMTLKRRETSQEDLALVPQAERPGVEADLQAVEAEVARLRRSLQPTYSLRSALSDYEARLRQVLIACRNFLPFDAFPVAETPDLQRVWSFAARFPGNPLDASQIAVAVGQQMREFLAQLVYIGPLREFPERQYVFGGSLTENVGKSGRMVPDILFTHRAVIDQVNEQFDRFRLGYDLELATGGTESLEDVFALRLKDRSSGVSISLLDVGFGISQVLPIVVQSMLAHGRTLCIEQPEIHLHPALQAELGGLLATAIEPPFSSTFIIETHSEHLLLRLQRLVREGVLSHESVSVAYVVRGPAGSRIAPLRMDRHGDFLDPWPGGFFEEGFREVFGIHAR
jgi:hypothetical protein